MANEIGWNQKQSQCVRNQYRRGFVEYDWALSETKRLVESRPNYLVGAPSVVAWRKVRLVPVTHAALVVLVVEDELLLRWSVTDCLREAGYSVVETASGEEAIAFCKSNMSIDIVFTDISLIGSVSGWDVGECCRAGRPDVSLIYTSGKSIDPERRVPGSAFIPKPYQYDEVVDACQRLHTK